MRARRSRLPPPVRRASTKSNGAGASGRKPPMARSPHSQRRGRPARPAQTGLDVAEDDCDVDLAGMQEFQRFGRMRVAQVDLPARRPLASVATARGTSEPIAEEEPARRTRPAVSATWAESPAV